MKGIFADWENSSYSVPKTQKNCADTYIFVWGRITYVRTLDFTPILLYYKLKIIQIIELIHVDTSLFLE